MNQVEELGMEYFKALYGLFHHFREYLDFEPLREVNILTGFLAKFLPSTEDRVVSLKPYEYWEIIVKKYEKDQSTLAYVAVTFKEIFAPHGVIDWFVYTKFLMFINKRCIDSKQVSERFEEGLKWLMLPRQKNTN